jgi:hypothetical protein
VSDVTPAERAFALQREDARHHFGLAVGIAKEGLRALLIVNGGAAVALIALAGSDKQTKLRYRHPRWERRSIRNWRLRERGRGPHRLSVTTLLRQWRSAQRHVGGQRRPSVARRF